MARPWGSRCQHEAVNIEKELNWTLAWSTSDDTPDTAGVRSVSRWAWRGTTPILDLESVPVQIIVFFFNIGDPLTRYVNAIEFVSVKTFI